MPDCCTLIVNPLSGGYTPRKVREARTALENLGLSCNVVETRTPDEAALRAGAACRESAAPLVVVAAGDGTVNGVVNGLQPGVATLAVLPFGTSNVLGRELGIASLKEGMDRIAAGKTRPVSVGFMEKDSVRRLFLLMAGIGFDGAIVKGVTPRAKRCLGKGAYLLSALRLVLAAESDRITVRWEGGSLDCHSVIVCNASRYAGNFSLAPQASLFEPGFQVVCLAKGRRSSLLAAGLALLSGKGPQGRDLVTFHAEELDVSGAKPIQADGDFYFHAPVRIGAIHDFMRLVV